MTDFSLDAVNFDMNVTSQPLIAEVDNNLNNLKFNYQKVNKQGNEYLDVREIMRDNSNAFDDAGDEINQLFGLRHKQYNPLVFFKELEIKIGTGLMFFGLTFDDLYLGRPQDWNVAD